MTLDFLTQFNRKADTIGLGTLGESPLAQPATITMTSDPTFDRPESQSLAVHS